MQNACEKEVQKYGGKTIALDANLNVDQQVSQLQTLINDKIDAIAGYPLDPQALAPVVAKPTAAGIPVCTRPSDQVQRRPAVRDRVAPQVAEPIASGLRCRRRHVLPGRGHAGGVPASEQSGDDARRRPFSFGQSLERLFPAPTSVRARPVVRRGQPTVELAPRAHHGQDPLAGPVRRSSSTAKSTTTVQTNGYRPPMTSLRRSSRRRA
jgi:hypothetical protein